MVDNGKEGYQRGRDAPFLAPLEAPRWPKAAPSGPFQLSAELRPREPRRCHAVAPRPQCNSHVAPVHRAEERHSRSSLREQHQWLRLLQGQELQEITSKARSGAVLKCFPRGAVAAMRLRRERKAWRALRFCCSSVAWLWGARAGCSSAELSSSTFELLTAQARRRRRRPVHDAATVPAKGW